MRTFRDETGRDWEVVAGRESWGAIVAIFVPRTGGAEIRQTVLRASSYLEATSELARLDERRLRELLRESRLKNP